jgi:2'-5' RNA ligase
MNCFLALRLADGPRDRIADLSRRLREWNLPAHWVHPEDLHLTLLFLGHCDADELRVMPSAIDELARGLPRPRLRLAGLGAFGGRTEPKVVFAALEDPDGACAAVHRDLSEMLSLTPEARFAPHITLCRPRPASPSEQAPRAAKRDWPQLLEAHGLADWGECATTDLVLYRSTDRTPRYAEVASWPLLGAA